MDNSKKYLKNFEFMNYSKKKRKKEFLKMNSDTYSVIYIEDNLHVVIHF